MSARLQQALEAVRVGCVVARHVQGQTTKNQLEKDDRSPVTVADFAVQAVIAQRLGELVGEESAEDVRKDQRILGATVEAVRSVWSDADATRVVEAIGRGSGSTSPAGFWVLDPIDGTKGFLRGQQYCIALAYVEQGRPVLGVLGCPNLPTDFDVPLSSAAEQGAIYYATLGGGAFEVAGSAPPRKIQASVPQPGIITFCESVESKHSNQEETRRIVDSLGISEVHSVRLDSQCKYAVVARGQADAYLRMPTSADYVEKIWDHAAGSLIASEAGCVVSDVEGAALDFTRGRYLDDNRGVIVSTRGLHSRLIDAMRT